MSKLQQIKELESMPLLGAQKLYAIEIADRLALEIEPDEEPNLALRLLIRRFLAQPNDANTLAQLAAAEAWATTEGETVLATKLQLIWCRYVGLTDPNAVPLSVLNTAIEKAKNERLLDAEWRLALAAVDRNDGMTLRQEALTYLHAPENSHERLQVHLELADDCHQGADILASLVHLQAAYSIAEAHQDPEQICACANRIGLHYITRGLPNKATEHLETALSVAISENNDLNILVNATLLNSLYLQAECFSDAARMADLLVVSGARRANWFAVVDGHITHSSILLVEANPAAAIERLVRAIVNLQGLVPKAAINILKGRLAELRHELDESVFDELHQEAVATHRSG